MFLDGGVYPGYQYVDVLGIGVDHYVRGERRTNPHQSDAPYTGPERRGVSKVSTYEKVLSTGEIVRPGSLRVSSTKGTDFTGIVQGLLSNFQQFGFQQTA